jgi:hypothetical protein
MLMVLPEFKMITVPMVLQLVALLPVASCGVHQPGAPAAARWKGDDRGAAADDTTATAAAHDDGDAPRLERLLGAAYGDGPEPASPWELADAVDRLAGLLHGAYGGRRESTSHRLDGLADGGVVLQQALAPGLADPKDGLLTYEPSVGAPGREAVGLALDPCPGSGSIDLRLVDVPLYE